ncbi:MAG TPA: dihydroxyacetone kinase phosphoryl donor subunit DhaM [Roseiflexaceae bacterium]|jgi:dihydroxyacetone kinase phosphotransfer subunit|nr:dihydroxyacetone kinase phosphoryl donor subunit DhaM [Roseiflexaceae bacterium]
MVGLLIVSHSLQLANGVKEFVEQVAGNKANIAAAGGTADGDIGTSVERIQAALSEVESSEGTLVLVDLGGAVLSVEMAIESLGKTDVIISDAPLVEGAYLAALEAAAGSTLQETAAAALQARALVKVHNER